MTLNTKMSETIQRLLAARRQMSLLQFDEEPQEHLGLPATPEAIARLERVLGKLPTGYRSFLEVHDGWADFEGDLKILATTDHGSDWFNAVVREKGGLFASLEGHNPLADWAMPILLGPTSSRTIAYDSRRILADGECEVVSFDYTQEEQRFPGFVAFLEHELEVTEAVVEDLRSGSAERE
jgi:hypothetical protein